MTTPVESPRPGADARAFGIDFALPDEVDLVGLAPPSSDAAEVPTVVRHDSDGMSRIWASAHPTRTREVGERNRVLLSVDHDPEHGYLLQAPGIGAALVSATGLDVRCVRESGPSDWNSLLLGQVLPLVATVRGLEVFHAAGIVHDDRTYLLAGAQGVGKTSLATHLVMAGAGLLSDDVVAIDDRLVAHPGTSVLHLRAPEFQEVGARPTPGLRLLGTVRGRAALQSTGSARAWPLGGIYFLERDRAGPVIQSVPDPSPFSLLAATFNLSVRTPDRLAHHLDLCARISATVPVFRVAITPDHGAAELAPIISQHMVDYARSGVGCQ